jgi:hypothetical protein
LIRLVNAVAVSDHGGETFQRSGQRYVGVFWNLGVPDFAPALFWILGVPDLRPGFRAPQTASIGSINRKPDIDRKVSLNFLRKPAMPLFFLDSTSLADAVANGLAVSTAILAFTPLSRLVVSNPQAQS